jgi:hypothetical protein
MFQSAEESLLYFVIHVPLLTAAFKAAPETEVKGFLFPLGVEENFLMI